MLPCESGLVFDGVQGTREVTLWIWPCFRRGTWYMWLPCESGLVLDRVRGICDVTLWIWPCFRWVGYVVYVMLPCESGLVLDRRGTWYMWLPCESGLVSDRVRGIRDVTLWIWPCFRWAGYVVHVMLPCESGLVLDGRGTWYMWCYLVNLALL